MDLSFEDLLKILEIVKNSHFDSVHIQVGTQSLRLDRGSTAAATAGRPAAQFAQPAAANVVTQPREAEIVVRAPRLGIYSRSPGAGQPPCVRQGDKVQADRTIGTVDVLGALHAVTAGTAGSIKQILVEDGQLVEYGQPLVMIAARQAPQGGVAA